MLVMHKQRRDFQLTDGERRQINTIKNDELRDEIEMGWKVFCIQAVLKATFDGMCCPLDIFCSQMFSKHIIDI